MQEKLFNEFGIPSVDDWINAVNKELKGKDYREALKWVTEDGIEMLPFYSAIPEEAKGLPGEFPFLRGTKQSDNHWEINQEIFIVDNFVTANHSALSALESGATAITFNGQIEHRDDLDILLKGIEIAYIQIHFRNSKDPLLLAELLKSYCERNDINFNNLSGSVCYDPIVSAAFNGGWMNGEKADKDLVITLFNTFRDAPNFRGITVDATLFHNSGATPCQELAYAIATGADYLDILVSSGINAMDAASKIQFRFCTGIDLYQEICKLRAFRVLWSNVIECYNPLIQHNECIIDIETSSLYSAQKDNYTNLLRSTCSVFAAVCAGCNSVTVLPFDNNRNAVNHFAARMGRNIQLIIQHEAGLDRIADPAGGAYFIEHLTRKMIERSWEIFLEIEDKGGLISCLKNGILQEWIRQEAEKKKENFTNGSIRMIGVNVYPNTSEKYESLDPVPKDKQGEFPAITPLEFENEITLKQ